MTIRETILAALTGISLLAAPVSAGGPVIIEDRYDTAEPEQRQNWLVPVLIGGIILCAIACGGDDEPEAVKPPGPVCRGDC